MMMKLEDAQAAQELLCCLGECTAEISFSVECVTDSGSHPCVVPIDPITDRQFEAARLAVENGYYDTPRQATLSEIGDELDVTSSAASQLLNAVEGKLIRAFVENSC